MQRPDPRPPLGSGAACLLAALLVMAPWLNPWFPGPSIGAVSCLLGLVCLGLWMTSAPWQTVAWSAQVGWLAAAVVSAAMALIQYTGHAAAGAPWISPAVAGEAFANLRQPNQFASLTSIGLAVVLARGLPATVTWQRAGWLAVAALLAVANAASASRTGLVQWLVLLGAGAVLAWRMTAGRRWALVLPGTAATVYAAAALALPAVTGADRALVERIAGAAASCSSRTTLWANVLELIAQRPWTGWGWGELDYAHFITPFSGERFCAILDNAHNLPLHLAVELGLPVALAVCAAAAWVIWRAAPWREREPSRQVAWAVLLVIGIHSLVEFPLWYGPFQMAAVLAVLMLVPRPLMAARGTMMAIRAAGAASVVIGAALAWDYWKASQIYLPVESRMAAWRSDTLAQSSRVRWFTGQVDFAALTITPLTRQNAAAMHDLAWRVLHYSPEPRVIERLIESATLLGRDAEALRVLARYRDAFPREHAQWALRQTRPAAPP